MRCPLSLFFSYIYFTLRKSLIIGVDIGSESHYARAFNWRGQEYGKKVFHFNDDVEGYKAFKGWVEAHKARTGAEAVIVGFEPTGHYWFSFGRYVKQMGMMLVLVNIPLLSYDRPKGMKQNNNNHFIIRRNIK